MEKVTKKTDKICHFILQTKTGNSQRVGSRSDSFDWRVNVVYILLLEVSYFLLSSGKLHDLRCSVFLLFVLLLI